MHLLTVVSGPSSSTVNAVVTWGDTEGMLLQDNPPVTIDSNGRLYAPTWCLVGDTGNTLSISMPAGEPTADVNLTFPSTIGVPDGEVLGLVGNNLAWIPTGTGN